uniref:Uncharacterized protein n=1 Tax=Anopheles culicifacies TaxID=139723 RepID=A0A182M7E2_9DIPT
MFRNRISVVRRAKAASKPSTVQSSLGSTIAAGDKGDGPNGLSVDCASLQSCVSLASSSTPADGNETVVPMECAKPKEGIYFDEAALLLDDSGEIGENELRLADEDDNDFTKDLDLSRPSPALFSLTSPKRARMMLEMQTSVDRNGSAGINSASSSTGRGALETPVNSNFVKPSVPETSQSLFRCVVNETPQPHEQQTPWSIRSSSQSKQAGEMKRQSITGAIDDLNEMTEELIDFIKSFEEKYPTPIN